MALVSSRLRSDGRLARLATLVRAIRDDDEEMVEAVMRLSRSRRMFAPLALCVGGLALLLGSLRLLISNWRLMLIQLLPAFWIWLAMFDLKLHVLHGKSFHTLRGPVLIPIGLVITAITIVGFFLNAVFAYAITESRPPDIRAAFASARGRLSPVVISGGVVGAALAFATTVAPRWGKPWFALTLGVVVGVMMLTYIAVPSRLIGVEQSASRRDKLATSVLSGAISVTVCTPPYILGRVGILMLGSRALLIPGVLLIAVGVTLQAGATGAVRAIKMGAAMAADHDTSAGPAGVAVEAPS